MSLVHLQDEGAQTGRKDKEVKTKDRPQKEKSAVDPLTLLKDDLLKAFQDKPVGENLSLSRFKDDLSNVFRFGLSVEKEKKKDSTIKVVTDEGNSKCLRKEEQLGSGFRETLSQQNKDSNTGVELNQPELGELDPSASEQKSETQEAPQRQTACFSDTNHTGSESSPAVELDTQDFSNFHQEDHKDTDTKMKEPEDCLEEHPSTRTEDKPSISFGFSSSRDETNQSAVTSLSRLSLLKDHVSLFRSKLSKEKDQDESSKLKVLKTERTDDPFKNPFKRDQQPCTCAADREEVKVASSQRKEEQLDCGFRETVLQQNKEKIERSNNNKICLNEAENLDSNRSQDKSQARLCEIQNRDGTVDASDTARTRGMFSNLFRRDPNPEAPEELEAGRRVPKRASGQKEETQQNKANNREDGLDPNASEQKPEASFSETPETGEVSRGKPAVVVEEHRESEIPDARHQENHADEDLKMTDPLKANHGKRTISSLALLKEDFHHFRDDLLSVFRIGPLKEKENKEDSSKVLNAEKNKELRNEKLAFGHRINFPPQNKETFITETTTDGAEPDGSKLDQDTSEEMTFRSHTVRFSAAEDADEQKVNRGRDARRPEAPGISLFSPRLSIDGVRAQLGDDLWSPKNLATYLTFDPNTANSELRLTDGNRKATRVWSDYRPSDHPDHPDRFLHCPQVLCREGLLDSVYWEVEWSGGADIGVAYNSISRGGDAKRCLLGHNERSWSLECSEGSYTPSYNNRRLPSFSSEPFSRRVGVHLDWSEGTLSFYCVSPDAVVHLHTFTSTFTEPLYAGFWVWAYGGSVSLCQVRQDWERLQ